MAQKFLKIKEKSQFSVEKKFNAIFNFELKKQ